ncbi:hypothetical protein [Chryseobacterium sp.]|uniref:hypothetical protein n=1 Tax=Chryseobacterium sp. TaxID=1871047 RepID=UPI0024E1EEEB|nr:hypothetical protein [Chryseobacterium sp.]
MKTLNDVSIAKKELEDNINNLMKAFEKANPEVNIHFDVENVYIDNENGESEKVKSSFKADIKIK